MDWCIFPSRKWMQMKTQILKHSSSEEREGLESPEKISLCCLSAVSGAWLPLAGQQVFGFEVKHVSVCFSLLALAVHSSLGVLHDFLCLLRHLRKKRDKHTHVKHRNSNLCLNREGTTHGPLDLLNRTGLEEVGRRSGCGFWRWEEPKLRVCVS